MHISEGILSPPALAAGWVCALAGVAVGARRTRPEDVPRVALLGAAFFVTTFMRIPIGPAHAHLVVNGLAGILLGWRAMPALFIALMLQAVLFQYGGPVVLGVNTVIIAGPAVLAHYFYRLLAGRAPGPGRAGMAGGLAGAGAVACSVAGMALCLTWTDPAFRAAAASLVLVHIPLMLIEGMISAVTVMFLYRVKKELLPGSTW
jgi:cobalt/nickel transport system permease protein